MKLFPPPSVSRAFQRGLKRAFDVLIAVGVLFILSPTLLFISVAIKIDSRGPIFRRYLRHGYDGENFQVLKFRCEQTTQDGRYGSRLTRVGRILRQTGLEDLPQLANVLRGEMSIVGPMPFVANPTTVLGDQISEYARQHKLKPGILGWAQVHDCWDEKNTGKRRIKFDGYYLEHWSFLLDMKIIVMALFSAIKHPII
jgi:lipopolysaccharide/colanic/teichoic acid biosynthesis glycosyltransferase